MTDERKGMPSASALNRYYQCRRSFQLEQQVPQLESKVASRGTYLHEITSAILGGTVEELEWASQEMPRLEKEEKEAVYKNLEIFNDVADRLPDAKILLEQRMSFWGLFSGKPDALILDGNHAYLFEWKYGLQPVPEVLNNLQTACYALLVFATYKDVERVYIQLSSPLAIGRKYSDGIFTRGEMEKVQDRIIKIFVDCLQPNAPLSESIGDHCQFCRAKSICPNYSENAKEMLITMQGEVSANPETTISADNVVQWAEKVSTFKKHIAEATKYAKNIEDTILTIAKQNANCGIVVKEKIGNRKFNTLATFQALNERYGISSEDFLKAVSVGVGALKNMLAEKLDIKTTQANKILETIDGISTREVSGEYYEIEPQTNGE